MSVLDRFSSSMGRRDQGPNQSIAAEISRGVDVELLEEVISATDHATPAIANDAVMTLMVVAEHRPEMLKPHVTHLFSLLQSTASRQVWGSMIALSHLKEICWKEIYDNLGLILDTMDKGSVVARDHGYSLLVALYEQDPECLWPLMKEQLLKCPPNQFGQYVEKTMPVILQKDLPGLVQVVEVRLEEFDNEYHRKRALKNLRKLRK